MAMTLTTHDGQNGPRAPTARGRFWLASALVPAALGPLWVVSIGVRYAPVGSFTGLVVVLLLAVTTWTDLERRKIPNWATYSAVLWAVAVNAATSLAVFVGATGWVPRLGGVGLVDGLTGAAACFALMLVPYRLAGGGAGDVKLATALGGLLGPQRGIDALVTAYILAGVVYSVWAIWTVGPVTLFAGLARSVGTLLLPGIVARPSSGQRRLLARPVPLAAFFAAGTAAVLAGWGAVG